MCSVSWNVANLLHLNIRILNTIAFVQPDDEGKGEAGEEAPFGKDVIDLLQPDDFGLFQNLHCKVLFYIRRFILDQLDPPKRARP